MGFNPQKIANYMLCNSNMKLPISNHHYITGKEISLFTNFVCVENTLSQLTGKCKCFFSTWKR